MLRLLSKLDFSETNARSHGAQNRSVLNVREDSSTGTTSKLSAKIALRQKSVVKALLIALLRAYQLLISPLFPPCCRYSPSCSRYAMEAVGTHGAIKGSWLILKRLLRCHPWGGYGFDPVPEAASKHSLKS
jgi:uncharacterized protein